MNNLGSIQAQRWAAERKAALRVLGGGSPADVLHRLTGQHPAAMDAVLGHLRMRLSDAEIAAWLNAPDTWSCRGRRPLELLGTAPDDVVEAARHAVAPSLD